MSSALPPFFTRGPLPQIEWAGLSFPTYYTVISLTYCLCILWFYQRCERRELSQQKAMDLAMILLLSGFVGARLFHILFESPQIYWNDPIQALYFWQGGFVFYGGFLAAFGSAYLFAKMNKLAVWQWADCIAPVLALGYGLGRIACFLVGCCYGKICALPWATPLEQIDIHTQHSQTFLRHPAPLYATAGELTLLAFLIFFERRQLRPGQIFFAWLFGHGGNRILMEYFRDDFRGSEFFGLSISTLISLALILFALWGFSGFIGLKNSSNRLHD